MAEALKSKRLLKCRGLRGEVVTAWVTTPPTALDGLPSRTYRC
ncbi:MAG: hypothetical protein ABI836_03265 [Gemmatimonadota bacterium]